MEFLVYGILLLKETNATNYTTNMIVSLSNVQVVPTFHGIARNWINHPLFDFLELMLYFHSRYCKKSVVGAVPLNTQNRLTKFID